MTACDQCRQAKKKCEFVFNSSSCTRCSRLGKICHTHHHRRNQFISRLAPSRTSFDGVLGGDDNPDVNDGGRIRTGSDCMTACHAPLSGAYPQILPIHCNRMNLQTSMPPSVEISSNSDRVNGGDDSRVVNDWRTRSERMAASPSTLAVDFSKPRLTSGAPPRSFQYIITALINNHRYLLQLRTPQARTGFMAEMTAMLRMTGARDLSAWLHLSPHSQGTSRNPIHYVHTVTAMVK